MKGKFAIDRALFDNPLWKDKPFAKGQAWIDLIGHAAYESTKVLKGYEIFEVARGQLFTTLQELADRWGWKRDKVDKFLKFLENEKQIERKSRNKGTLIIVENYNKYQFTNSKIGNETETKQKRNRNESETKQKPTLYKNKENNNNKNNKNTRVCVDEILSQVPSELLESLDAFIEMRNKIKAPLTGEGLKRIISKVNKLSGGDMDIANEIIMQSVERSWRGIFPIREEIKAKQSGVIDIMDIDISEFKEDI